MNTDKLELNRYSDWLHIFEKINQEYNLKYHYQTLIHGKLKDKKFSLFLFIKELTKFVNIQLDYFIQDWNNKIGNYISINDYDSLPSIIEIFSWQIHDLKFFEHLKFLPTNTIKQLSISIDQNIELLIKQFKNKIMELSSTNPRLFELDYLLLKHFPTQR